MLLTINEANQVIKVMFTKRVDSIDTYSVVLKSTGSWFGSIEVESTDTGQKARFTGQNWIYNTVNEDGELIMQYPVRADQYQQSSTEYIALEHQSALSQATLDALHYFWQTRTWQFPNYTSITFK
jgi:hypothetical protein